MTYRLVIDEIKDAQAITSYTRWVDAVQVGGAEDQEVYLTFSPRFAHFWLKSKKRLLEYYYWLLLRRFAVAKSDSAFW